MTRLTSLLVLLTLVLIPRPAAAQTIGTFRWQQQPYCNVVTLAVTQVGTSYRLEGTDDGCGTARQASAIGLAFPNPNGTLGMGLTIVTNDGGGTGGAPLHLDVAISLATVSGTWRDSTGQSGAFTFSPSGASSGGAARPAPVLTPGIVTSSALAPSAVTATALANGAVTAAKFDAAAFDGKFFSTVLAAGSVSASGTTFLRATTAAVTVTRPAVGTYQFTMAGLDPGCGKSKFIFVVASPTDLNRLARASAFSSLNCVNGDAVGLTYTTDLAGTLADSGFNFILFRVGG